MQQVNFLFEKTSINQFNKKTKEKIQNGILLASQIMKSSFFKELFEKFSWKDEDDNLYDRFHLSGGLSNKQVLESIYQGQHCVKPQVVIEEVHLYPFKDRKEIAKSLNYKKPAIWFNLNALKQSSYTELHVASCLLHEWCKILGFSADFYNQGKHYKGYSVPFAAGKILSYVGIEWAKKYPISFGHFLEIDRASDFYYHPSTDTFDLRYASDIEGIGYQKITEAIDLLYKEWFSLRTNEIDDRIANRILIIKDSIKTLEEVLRSLLSSSLDGGEKTFENMPIFSSK